MAKRTGGRKMGKVSHDRARPAERRHVMPAEAPVAAEAAASLETAAQQAATTPRQVVAARPAGATLRRGASAVSTLTEDYTHVRKDLYRVLVITSLIVVILVALSFFLR